MREDNIVVERLQAPVSSSDVRALAELLIETVAAGEAVSFVNPLSMDDALAWWTGVFSGAHPRATVLVARDGEVIRGTVQLHPAWAPNQPHRAEVVKLMVSRQCQRLGLGRRLMQEIEALARQDGFTLLTLDAKRSGTADRLYRRLGWIEAGIIPAFAFDPDGHTPHDAVFFYKHLGGTADAQAR